jgi:hypothetical protein
MSLIWSKRFSETFGPAYKWVIDGFRDEDTKDFQSVKNTASKIISGAETSAKAAVKSGQDFQTFRNNYNQYELSKTSSLPIVWRQVAKTNPVLKWVYITAYLGGSVFAFLSDVFLGGSINAIVFVLFGLIGGLLFGLAGFLIFRLSLYCLSVAEFSHWLTALIVKAISIPAIAVSAIVYAIFTVSNIITPMFAVFGLIMIASRF